MTESAQTDKIIRVTLVRSAIGFSKRHKATVRALGLHRLHQSVEHVDTPALRGMLYQVARLVEVDENE
ncbi:MAG TPA: 50S ribosomal protein L30 [Anaerolineales bacterium]